MTVQSDNYGIGASGTASQKFTFTAPNDGTFKLGRGVLGAESSFPIVINADDSISGNMGLGAGQAWQNLLGSRASNTTYTNSTGKPIAVSIRAGAINENPYITVAGVVVTQTTNSTTFIVALFAIVPNGATYSFTSGTAANVWAELR